MSNTPAFFVIGPFETAEAAQAMIDGSAAGTHRPGVRVLEFAGDTEPVEQVAGVTPA